VTSARELVDVVDAAVPRLRAIDAARATVRPAPGKWSPQEIIGHLIDSASNNHQRFVRAQFQDDLVFNGYAQDDWVATQQYQQARWDDLVTLWASFNRHLAHVMQAVPERVRARPHTRHSLDRHAFRAVASDAPATLDYFMQDYVEHLKHHLRQIPGL
jgi:hypothetical protein